MLAKPYRQTIPHNRLFIEALTFSRLAATPINSVCPSSPLQDYRNMHYITILVHRTTVHLWKWFRGLMSWIKLSKRPPLFVKQNPPPPPRKKKTMTKKQTEKFWISNWQGSISSMNIEPRDYTESTKCTLRYQVPNRGLGREFCILGIIVWVTSEAWFFKKVLKRNLFFPKS